VPRRLRGHLPQRVDLRPRLPPAFDQKHLNACSANAIAAAMWFVERKHAIDVARPSRLFLYYNERASEGVISINGTVSLRDGYTSVTRLGVCSERSWPYDVLRYRRRPPPRCYREALSRRAIWYGRLDRSLAELKGCLAEGYPFTVGISVYKSFTGRAVSRSGIVPMPRPHHEKRLGGHAMLVVGYSDSTRHFIVRNSWGPRWGDHGSCHLPYEYLMTATHAWDFWTVRRLE
jgi:C1A family cysteine protease